MLLGKVPPQVQGLHVGSQQLFFAFVLLTKQLFNHLGLDLQQHRKRAHVNDIFEELALAWVAVHSVANLGKRHADHMHVFAKLFGRQGPGAVVKQIAARLQLGHIGIPGLWVHGYHHVDAAASAQIALLTHPHLVPGGQALDIAGENIAWTHWHAHAQDRLGKQLVGRGRARAVDVGELDDEIVDGFDAFHK